MELPRQESWEPPRAPRRGRLIRRLASVIILLSCVDQPTGPGNYDSATVDLQLTLPEGTPEIWFPRGDTLHVMVRRAGRPAPISEVLVVVGDSLRAELEVPIASSVERFVATAEVRVGGQIFFLAFDAIQLRAGLDTTIEMQAAYVGPAAAAAAFTIVPRDSTLRRSDTTSFVVEALDSLGQAISTVPLRFSSERPAIIAVTDSGIAAAAPDAAMDTVRVVAWTPTGLSNSALFRVVRGSGGIPVTTEVIAFISMRDGSRELYMMNEDGTGAQRLTETVEDEYRPAWSPDRSEIAFEREVSGERQIIVLDVATGEERQLTTAGSNTGPRWRPDGGAIAFTSTAGGGRAIWTMAPDGSSQRRLVDPGGALDGFSDWAPDGSAFVFVRQPPGFSHSSLHVANADGSDIVEYPFDGPLPADFARWSPRGGELVVERTTGSGTNVSFIPAIPGHGGDLPARLPRRTSEDRSYSFAGTAHEFVFESAGDAATGIYRGDTTGISSRLSPTGVEEVEPDHAPPASPIYVAAVSISPPQAALTSDESTRRFTATVTDAGGRAVTVPLTWSGGADGRYYGTPQGLDWDVVAVAVGSTRVTATYLGWRSDTADVTITPATGPMARRIVLTVGSELFTMRGDGTDTVRLTTLDGETDSDPAWSPDGSRVAWRAVTNGQDDIFVMNADGTGRQRLTNDAAQDGQPSWSPDGRRLVFHSAPPGSGSSALWLMDADGGNRVQLTSGSSDFDPAWSPDGSLIAFARIGGPGPTLHTITPDGTGLRAVETGPGSVRYPAWSADGSMLFYAITPSGGLSRIARVPFPSGAEVQLTTGRGPFNLGLGGDFEPSVAEDGTITFWSFRHSFAAGQQMVMRADGSAQSGLLPVNTVSGVGAWRPDAPPRYAAAVTISGDVTTPLVVGAVRTLTAAAVDQAGSAISPIGGLQWRSLDPGVASVDASGVVRGISAGPARIVASTGIAAPDTAMLAITTGGPAPAMTRLWVGGSSAGATDWFVAANWNPAGVPGSQDSVVISAAASQPVLTGDAAVHEVRLTSADARLTLNGHSLATTGDAQTTTSGGVIVMQHPADTLRVGGDASFGGSPATGSMTAGTIIVSGDFEVLNDGNIAVFAPSGTHRTVLAGSTTQEIRFSSQSVDVAEASFFRHLEIAKDGGDVLLASGFSVTGVLRVSSASQVVDTVGFLWTVADSLVTAAGSALSLQGDLALGGVMAVGGAYAVGATILTGQDQVLQPGLAYEDVVIVGTARLAGRTTVAGDVDIAPRMAGETAELSVAGYTLSIGDDLETGPDGGVLVMQHTGDSVVVGDDVRFGGASSAGRMTAGVLIAQAEFEQSMASGSGASFAPSGTHRTVLRRRAGAPPEVRFENGIAGATESFFNDLDLATDTVFLLTRVTVAGTLRADPGPRRVLMGSREPLVANAVSLPRLRLNDVPLEVGPGALTRLDSLSFGRANYDAPQLTVRHPGAASPFTFTGLSFNDDAQSGTFVRAVDVAPDNGATLVIDIVDANPTDGSAQTVTEGGAIVNWRSTAAGGTLTWVGAGFGPSWSEEANWSPARRPTLNDTVIIAPAAQQPELNGPATVAKLTINGPGTRLRLNGYRLTVRGDFATGPNGGTVVMQTPADTLQVEGATVFAGDPTIGLLTDGVLMLGGNFRQQYVGSNWAGFAPSGAHQTILFGFEQQNLRFDSPAGAPAQRSFFHHLRVDKSAGDVWFASDAVINGKLDVRTPTLVRDLEKRVIVHDSLTTVTGSELRIDGWLRLGGGMNVAGDYRVTTTEFFGADQVIQPGLSYTDVRVDGRARFAGRTDLGGSLQVGWVNPAGNVIPGDLALNGQTVTVAHGFQTVPNGGTLTMTSAADTLRVLGDAAFYGAPTIGTLTAGALIVAGDFRQAYIGSNWAGFAPSGTHRTVLAGTQPQVVHFDNPDGAPTQRSRFHHLSIENPTTVTLATRAYANGDFALASIGTLDGAATLVVAGALSSQIESTLRPARVDVAGPVAIAGTFAADTIEYWGASQAVQPGLPYRQLIIGGTAHLAGATTASGVVVQAHAFGQPSDLDLAGQQLTVAGDFRTGPNGGSLTMMAAADLLTIGGNATFSGDVTLGRLTAGEMRLAGNFRQQYIGGNWAAFSPSGSHRVVLTGAAAQTLNFDSPDGAPTQRSHFHDLVLAGGGGVTLASRTYVRGTLRVTAPVAPVVTGSGADFIALGVDVPRLTLDNAPMTLGAGTITRFDSVTFQGFAPGATQLTVAHPGAAATVTLTGLRFLVAPTTGWYVSATDTDPSNGLSLRISMVGAQPADGSARTQTSGGAIVTWGEVNRLSLTEARRP